MSITDLPSIYFYGSDWVYRNYVPNDPGPVINGPEERLLYYIASFGKDGVSMLDVLNKFTVTRIHNYLLFAVYRKRIIIQREDGSYITPASYLDLAKSESNKIHETDLPFFDARGNVVPIGARLDNCGNVINSAKSYKLDSATSDFWNKAEQIFSWS